MACVGVCACEPGEWLGLAGLVGGWTHRLALVGARDRAPFLLAFWAALRARSSGVFLQDKHLQLTPQAMPAWKHSQYFFWQPDFLQWQPFVC